MTTQDKGLPRNGRPADSAGLPWAGRTLPTSGFTGDDGSADPRLADALDAVLAGSADDHAVVRALAAARVFVPVVAMPGEDGQAAHATDPMQRVDRAAHLALVTITGPDGRRALPVFASTTSLAAWDDLARPVPVEARRAALSAVTEGCDLMVLDPAGPVTYVVSRPALWALGAGRDWLPADRDDDVLTAVGRAVNAEQDVVTFRAAPGRTAQLKVTVVVRAGLSSQRLQALAERVADALQGSAVVRERVDGVELAVSAT